MLDWLFAKRPPLAITALGLTDWWNKELTPGEREALQRLTCLNSDPSRIRPPRSATIFLVETSSWFTVKRDRHIAKKLLAKASDLAGHPYVTIMDLHFLHGTIAKIWYPGRDNDPAALSVAIEACRRQIAIAPQAAKEFRRQFRGSPLPGHYGYKQLVTILKKQGKRDQATALAKQAASQGWIV